MVGKKCVCDGMARHVRPGSRNRFRKNLDLIRTSFECICIRENECLCGQMYKEMVIEAPIPPTYNTQGLISTLKDAVDKKTWRESLATTDWKAYTSERAYYR